MFTVKLLHTPELIADASALLYQVYIEELQWKFAPDNPSKLRIETENGRKVLVDRFTEKAVWFGAFENKELIGCMRLTKPDSNNKFELEGYQSSKIIHKYLPKPENGVELSKIAVQVKYAGQGVIKRMWLVVFKYCEAHKLSVICTTHNGYLKNMFKRIGFPLVMEHAFKYEPLDPLPVNLYVTDSQKHISDMVYALECLDGDLNPNSSKIFKALELVAPILPVSTYWHDVNGVVLGVNEHCLNRIGSSYQDIVGKSPYEFYPEHTAEHIVSHNTQVIRSGEIMVQEEWIEDITTGKPKCFSSTKAPLYDDEGTIIGVIGSFVEITGEKEAEKLRLENQAHLTAAEKQEEFKKIVGQMVHDIGSPLATLQTIMQSATGLPENERIALREAAISITDITNNMLNRFNPTNNTASENDIPQPVLIYAALSQAISQKRYQYKKLPIQFEFKIDEADGEIKLSHEAEDANFAFIKIEPSAFKRMISNLINNAVDALDKKSGGVTLKLNADKEWVTIRVCDSGKGMSPEIQQKIINNIRVTEGKENGHGLGMMQIRETLSRNYAEFFIDSEIGKGTEITLKFPRISPPNWIATEIKVTPKDTIVVLDDETSMHNAWDTRFKKILKANSTLQVKHFSVGEETVDFINNLTPDEKQNIYLLTDYELLQQKLDGIEVIEQVALLRCILVTSHYADPKLHNLASKIGIKLLPKDLVHNVKIQVEQKFKPHTKKVDIVFIEDVRVFVDQIVESHYKNKKVDVYYDPISFLENVDQYPLNTRMIIDSTYNYDGKEYDLNGFDVALKLHEKGYTKLYLFTSDHYSEDRLPPYLKYINKMDRDVVKNLHKL